MILAGDIGGTKTILAYCDGAGTVLREATFQAAEYPSLEAIIDAFRQPDEPIAAACFGVAGPIAGGAAKVTNLPWHIAETTLAHKLDARVSLLNDLQATALGTLVLPPSAFVVLQEGTASAPTGTIAVIAPGTGLGEALLLHDGDRYRALPTEAGHADFAPGTEQEIDLLRFLRAKYGWHVSYERVLSGNGIGDLYRFARSRLETAEPEWLTAELSRGDHNAVVSKAALEKRDDACILALDLFVQILGAEAGNLALRGLCFGGVVIGGGIPPKITAALTSGALMGRFNAKGRFSPWMQSLRVRVALEPRAALLGAAWYAAATVGP
jgi:glucokinase